MLKELIFKFELRGEAIRVDEEDWRQLPFEEQGQLRCGLYRRERR